MSRLVDWAKGHRSAVATAVSSVVIAGLVAGVAITSTGYESRRLDLDDGTVWAANGSRTAIGRANVDVGELNSAVRSQGSDVAVAQGPEAVVMVDRSSATAGVVDTATATVEVSTPLPPDRPDVLVRGDQAIVVSGGTGELWTLPVAELDSFASDSEPDLGLGGEIVTGLSPDGALVVYSADSGRCALAP